MNKTAEFATHGTVYWSAQPSESHWSYARTGWPQEETTPPNNWQLTENGFERKDFTYKDSLSSAQVLEDIDVILAKLNARAAENLTAESQEGRPKKREDYGKTRRRVYGSIAAGLMVFSTLGTTRQGRQFAHDVYNRYLSRRNKDEHAYESPLTEDVKPESNNSSITEESATESIPAPSVESAEIVPISIVDEPLDWYELSTEEVETILNRPANIMPLDQLQPHFQDHFRFQDLNATPEYRASTLQILTPTGEGSGSLVEHEGQLYVRSIRHVVDIADYEGAEAPMFWVYMPGIGITELPEYLLAFHEDGGDYRLNQDTNVLIPLRYDLENKVRTHIANGEINPLTISDTAPVDVPNQEDYFFIPNPETGGYIRLTMQEAATPNDEAKNVHIFTVDDYQFSDLQEAEEAANLICAGFSGSPVIDANDSRKIHGSVSAISWDIANWDYTDGHDRICSIQVHVQEN